MKFLTFQIYAPLVSWGEISVGEERHSARHPSKSAVIGLIAAALGISREEEKKLNDLGKILGVAVKLYSGGSILKDFHTAQVPKTEKSVVYYTRKAEVNADKKKIGTILSRREYRCDALAVVAIYLKYKTDELTLGQIAEKLKHPEFQLYFGRKSCVPALPLDPKLIEAENLNKAFTGYPIEICFPEIKNDPEWLKQVYKTYPEKTLFDKNGMTFYWEEGIESGFEKSIQSVDRYDQPISRKRWQFSSRREFMTIENASNT